MPPQYHALILENQSSVSQYLVNLLGKAGFETTEASDAQSALSTLKLQTFSLFVLDITQSHQAGMELLKQVRKDWPILPIIVVTDEDTIPFAEDVNQAGPFESLAKPFADDDLIRMAQRVVAQLSVSDDSATNAALDPMDHKRKSMTLSGDTIVAMQANAVARKTKNVGEPGTRLFCTKCTTREQLASSRMTWYEYPIAFMTFMRPFRCTCCYRRYWRRPLSAASKAALSKEMRSAHRAKPNE